MASTKRYPCTRLLLSTPTGAVPNEIKYIQGYEAHKIYRLSIYQVAVAAAAAVVVVLQLLLMLLA